MSTLLDKAVETVKALPLEAQDEIARTMLHLAASDAEPEEIDPAHLPAVLEGLAQVTQRQFATDVTPRVIATY